jgi:thiamine-phosphate pyrophosphorylase
VTLAHVRVVVITPAVGDRRATGELVAGVRTLLAAVPREAIAVQVRDKSLDGRALFALAHSIVEVARDAGAPVWVNDRLDVALAAGADGVHLPERGLAIADARAALALAGQRLAIGCSRHAADTAVVAAHHGADLVQLGPVWEVSGKAPPLGVDVLGVRRHLPAATRLIAVGGIDGPMRAREAARAGADAVAVIRAAWGANGPDAIARLVDAVEDGIADRRG